MTVIVTTAEELRAIIREELTCPWERGSEPGFVYFMGAPTGIRIKIGYSKDPQKRLSGVRVGSPSAIVLRGMFPASRDVERGLHRYFADDHISGEWFYMSPPMEWLIDFSHTRIGVYVARRFAAEGLDG